MTPATISSHLLTALIGFILLVPVCKAEEPLLKTSKDKLNYAIGVEIARNYKTQGLEIDPDLVVKGIRDALAGERLLIPEKEQRSILISAQSEIRRKQSPKKPVITENKTNKETTK